MNFFFKKSNKNKVWIHLEIKIQNLTHILILSLGSHKILAIRNLINQQHFLILL